MNPNTSNKEKDLNIKWTKGPDPIPDGEKNSVLNPALLFSKLAKDTDAGKETVRINIRIDDNISKDEKTN